MTNSRFKCFDSFYVTLLQCPCLAYIQCDIPYKCCDCLFFQLEAEGSTHEIFLLVESFLRQCNATSYFTFASAVLGHRASKITTVWLTTVLYRWLPFSTINTHITTRVKSKTEKDKKNCRPVVCFKNRVTYFVIF